MSESRPPSVLIDDGGASAVRAARRRYAIFLAVCAAIAVVVVVAANAVLLPFVLALVIAYVLTPAVSWVEKRVRLPRALSILIVYVIVLGSIYGFVRVTAPRVGHELAGLRRELPALAQTIRGEWVPYVQGRLRAIGLGGPVPEDPPPEPRELPDTPAIVARPRADGSFAIEIEGPLTVTPNRGGGYTIGPVDEEQEPPPEAFDVDKIVADFAGKSMVYAQQNVLEVVKFGRDVVAGISRVLFVFGITLMLAAYMILTRERIFAFFTSLVRPRSRPAWHELIGRVDRGLSGVVRGQLVICVVNGALSAIGFAFIGLKYWPVLAIVATVLSIIPIFGSIVSAVPAVALGLTQSFGTAVIVLLWIIGIHQLEANVLNPKILGDAAKLHPLLVIFSLLVGEHFFGVVGALLAVPVMSITQSAFIHVRKSLHELDPEMVQESVASVPPPPK